MGRTFLLNDKMFAVELVPGLVWNAKSPARLQMTTGGLRLAENVKFPPANGSGITTVPPLPTCPPNPVLPPEPGTTTLQPEGTVTSCAWMPAVRNMLAAVSHNDRMTLFFFIA